MKSIKEIKRIVDADFEIRWQITYMCNLSCYYCIQYKKRVDFDKDLLFIEQKKNELTAKKINSLIEQSKFENVQFSMVGGEASLFDIQRIMENIPTRKIKTFHLISNMTAPVEFYINLSNYLKSRGCKFELLCSYHEQTDLESFFKKAKEVKQTDAIVSCEKVSLGLENKEECKLFIERCRSENLIYKIDGDSRVPVNEWGRKGIFATAEVPIKQVEFMDGTFKKYNSRSELVSDHDILESYKINTQGLILKGFKCSSTNNFLNIIDSQVMHCSDSWSLDRFKLKDEPIICTKNKCSCCFEVDVKRCL